MRYLLIPLLLVVLAFGLLPYYQMYRLDRALMLNDQETLAALVDLDRVRGEQKRHLENSMDRLMGDTRTPFSQALRQGAAAFTSGQVDSVVTLEWIRDTLRPISTRSEDGYPSLSQYTTFAFFEGPTRFLQRIRDLGERPLHLRWTLRDGRWRVTGIYLP